MQVCSAELCLGHGTRHQPPDCFSGFVPEVAGLGVPSCVTCPQPHWGLLSLGALPPPKGRTWGTWPVFYFIYLCAWPLFA